MYELRWDMLPPEIQEMYKREILEHELELMKYPNPFVLGVDPVKEEPQIIIGEVKVDENEKENGELESRYSVALLYRTKSSDLVLKHSVVDALSETDALGMSVQLYQEIGDLIHFSTLVCSRVSNDLDAKVLELVKDGKKIQAIKEVREITGMYLKEAKDYVDMKIQEWKQEGVLEYS